MSHRRVLTACTTLGLAAAAVGTGVATAAPVPTATPTPLAQAIEKALPSVSFPGNHNVGSLGSGGSDIRFINSLIANADNCDQAAAAVGTVPADSAQAKDKTEWLNGDRLQAHYDVELANAAIVSEAGHFYTAEKMFRALVPTENLVNRETGLAEEGLGISRPRN